jgi:hypothetical protein
MKFALEHMQTTRYHDNQKQGKAFSTCKSHAEAAASLQALWSPPLVVSNYVELMHPHFRLLVEGFKGQDEMFLDIHYSEIAHVRVHSAHVSSVD